MMTSLPPLGTLIRIDDEQWSGFVNKYPHLGLVVQTEFSDAEAKVNRLNHLNRHKVALILFADNTVELFNIEFLKHATQD